ncbi:unnamed protein product [Urochloa decumbens]|uniref:Uncharacterized protein n=1 Tax=Urochloa decumbens TaxID=240449 RepID=A0ABC9G1F5_9POAL
MLDRSINRNMALPGRFLNLIVCHDAWWMIGAASLRCLDLTRHQFFRPPPPPEATERRRSEPSAAQHPLATRTLPLATAMEELHLPDPTLTFQAEIADRIWRLNCFPLADRRVLCADHSGRAFPFDADTRNLVTMPSLHKPKQYPISLFVPDAGDGGGSLLVIEEVPRPEYHRRETHTSDQFEAFVCRRKPAAAESWRCQLLPPPPYLRDSKYWQSRRSHKIAAYGVVDGGSQVCISVEGVGTYCLDTASHTWSEVGKWTLPFVGKFEYVPELKLWFGISAAGAQNQKHLLAAADLSAMDYASQPQLVGCWKEELEPPKEWMDCGDPQLVSLGSGRFCIARFFALPAAPVPGFGDLKAEGYFEVLTGVEVTPSVRDGKCSGSGNGQVELQMSTHKSLRCTGIQVVF